MVDLILTVFKDIQPGRLVESLIVCFVLMARVKPHLSKIETTLKEFIEVANRSFKNGDERFDKIETRLDVIEGQKPMIHSQPEMTQ